MKTTANRLVLMPGKEAISLMTTKVEKQTITCPCCEGYTFLLLHDRDGLPFVPESPDQEVSDFDAIACPHCNWGTVDDLEEAGGVLKSRAMILSFVRREVKKTGDNAVWVTVGRKVEDIPVITRIDGTDWRLASVEETQGRTLGLVYRRR